MKGKGSEKIWLRLGQRDVERDPSQFLPWFNEVREQWDCCFKQASKR